MADNTTETYGSPPADGYAPPAQVSGSASESESDVENGSRKRKRPMNVTCEACKSRKVKCDRGLPSCGWCARNDNLCEYKERKKPGLRAGYGRELETKIQHLEDLVYQQGRQLAAHVNVCRIALADSSQLPEGHDAGRQLYDTQLGGLNRNSHFPQQAIDPELRPSAARQESLQYGASHQTSVKAAHTGFTDQYTSSAEPQLITSPQSATAYTTRTRISNDFSATLPPYDLLYALVDLFFKHINSWLPLLDRKATVERLFGPTPLEEADRVLLHAIVTATLRFSNDARLTPESRQHYHDNSKRRTQLYGLEISSVRALQALVILALDVTGTTNGPESWNLISLISRSVVQLGLSLEATSSVAAPMSIATLRASMLPEAKTWIEDEERRRLFWAVYLLDRYATIQTAFEFALDNKEVDRRLPCRDDLFAADQPTGTRYFRPFEQHHFTANANDGQGYFAYHCELIGILGKIHQFLKRPVDISSLTDVEQWQGTYRALDSELNAWHFSLPDEFADVTRMMKSNVFAKAGISTGWISIHAAYYLALIRLNSSAAYPSQTSPIFSSSYSAMQRCLTAVENMRHLAQFVSMNDILNRLGSPFAFTIWVCARVTLVHGSTMDHEVGPNIDFFISVLSAMGQLWEVARRYSEILSRVLSEYRQSEQSGHAAGERRTPSTVRILADMRRCAVDLDILISRQPHGSRSYQPTRHNSPTPHELEYQYLDVFDIFNFPRLPIASGVTDQMMPGIGHDATEEQNRPSGMNAAMLSTFAVPDPEADWLFQTS